MNTVWQIVDLESEKVFFTTRDSQAERWNNDEQFEVTTSPSRRPVAGYTTWMLDSNTDRHSLKLGLECECLECCDGEHVGRCRECAGWGESDCKPCEHCDRTGVCPKCHGKSLPVCVLCDLPVSGSTDLAEYEKNGAHVKCAEKELTGDISLCKCGVWLRTDISICPRCEKPYFADGRTIAGSHADERRTAPISLCKCAVRQHGVALCPQCEKPYSADGHVFTGRSA